MSCPGGLADIEVVYGVFPTWSRTASGRSAPRGHTAPDACLAAAPAGLAEFEELAIRMALREGAKWHIVLRDDI